MHASGKEGYADKTTGAMARLGNDHRSLRKKLLDARLLAPLRHARRRGHVLMFHIGRSGSTVVGDLLNQHPQLRWEGEIYQRIFSERQNADGSLPPVLDVDPVGYATERASRAFGRYYGFETKFFHLRAIGAELCTYLDGLEERMPELRFVVLRRRNTLRKVVSTLVARKTRIWHRRTDARLPRSRVFVDPEAVFVDRADSRLVELLQQYERDFSLLDELLRARPALKLTYEDDVAADPRRAYRRICEFLDVPVRSAAVTFSRTNPYPLHELIENFDEIESLLRGTEFEWMLRSG